MENHFLCEMASRNENGFPSIVDKVKSGGFLPTTRASIVLFLLISFYRQLRTENCELTTDYITSAARRIFRASPVKGNFPRRFSLIQLPEAFSGISPRNTRTV